MVLTLNKNASEDVYGSSSEADAEKDINIIFPNLLNRDQVKVN